MTSLLQRSKVIRPPHVTDAGTRGHCKLLPTTAQQRSATKLPASGLMNAARDKCWQPICSCSVITEWGLEIYRSIMKREMMVAWGGWRTDFKGISVTLFSKRNCCIHSRRDRNVIFLKVVMPNAANIKARKSEMLNDRRSLVSVKSRTT